MEAQKQLTEREREVLMHLAYGAADKEIADKLCIVVSTVYTHNKSIYAKLGVRGRVEAAAYYWRNIHEFMDSVQQARSVF